MSTSPASRSTPRRPAARPARTSATGAQASGQGYITVASAINWASANTLTLNAYGGISLDANITGTAGTLSLSATNAAIIQTGNSVLAVGTLTGSDANYAVTLSSAGNQIAMLGAFSTGSNLYLVNSVPLSITGAVSASVLTLKETGGGIDASTGAITATQLAGSSAGAALFTNAANSIAQLGLFTNTGGAFSLTDARALAIVSPLNAAGQTVTLAATGAIGATYSIASVAAGIFDLTNGNWTQNVASLPAFTVTDFRFNPTTASFLRVTGGAGTAASPYQIADAHGLQGMASSSLLASSFALTKAIDLSGTAGWNAGAGFVPIGTDGNSNIWNGTACAARDGIASAGFTGVFDGGGYTLSGLSITRPSASYVGLFGYVRTATVRNAAVAGTVSAANDAGGVIGHAGVATGSTVSNVTSGVNITGAVSIGGLIGYADSGAISNAVASGTVGGSGNVGGLIGGAGGSTTTTIESSSASGAVTASSAGAGGLIGLMTSNVTVTASSATAR